jgi:hypothetical protein
MDNYSKAEKADAISDVLYYKMIEKENPTLFYDMELYDDLALCEVKARDMGIDIGHIIYMKEQSIFAKFIEAIKNFIFDLHPEMDESHSLTRYKEI